MIEAFFSIVVYRVYEEMKKTLIGRLTIFFLILLASWFGYSCVTYNNYNQQPNLSATSNYVLSKINPLADRRTESMRGLQVRASEQDKTLGFMVWPEERIKVLEQAIQLTREQINIEPAQVSHWQRLLNLQYELEPESQRISWILDKIYLLDGWNLETLIVLSRYCVPFAFIDGSQAPETCSEIFANLLPQYQKATLGHLIGIGVEDLEVVLNRYQVNK